MTDMIIFPYPGRNWKPAFGRDNHVAPNVNINDSSPSLDREGGYAPALDGSPNFGD